MFVLPLFFLVKKSHVLMFFILCFFVFHFLMFLIFFFLLFFFVLKKVPYIRASQKQRALRSVATPSNQSFRVCKVYLATPKVAMSLFMIKLNFPIANYFENFNVRSLLVGSRRDGADFLNAQRKYICASFF